MSPPPARARVRAYRDPDDHQLVYDFPLELYRPDTRLPYRLPPRWRDCGACGVRGALAWVGSDQAFYASMGFEVTARITNRTLADLGVPGISGEDIRTHFRRPFAQFLRAPLRAAYHDGRVRLHPQALHG